MYSFFRTTTTSVLSGLLTEFILNDNSWQKSWIAFGVLALTIIENYGSECWDAKNKREEPSFWGAFDSELYRTKLTLNAITSFITLAARYFCNPDLYQLLGRYTAPIAIGLCINFIGNKHIENISQSNPRLRL